MVPDYTLPLGIVTVYNAHSALAEQKTFAGDAHNAMSLKSLLETLREYKPARLVCLFGCGGNRSGLRRLEMGEASGQLADYTIITSDNPRFEDPQAIIEDIKTGILKTNGAYIEIIDRKEAIRYAITHGEPGDVIVLAGKGHEDYQEIILPFLSCPLSSPDAMPAS